MDYCQETESSVSTRNHGGKANQVVALLRVATAEAREKAHRYHRQGDRFQAALYEELAALRGQLLALREPLCRE
jgi:hypothetical protein